MPAESPAPAEQALHQLATLGADIRARRQQLRISATALAEAAGMSRVTLHRIEKGEPSVTIGAYFNAIAALGLEAGVLPADSPATLPALPERIALTDYPQLRQLAWNIAAGETVSAHEARDLYERNARHLDTASLSPQERALIDALRALPGTPGDKA
jgi:transcriptional regulator with XRE-family HTH domain